jgi:hypothetical protein
VVARTGPGSVAGYKPGASAKLEVFLGQKALALGSDGLGQMPEQELLTYRGRRQPYSRLERWIQFGILRPKSRLPNIPLHQASSV